jgi:hypothetical protein
MLGNVSEWCQDTARGIGKPHSYPRESVVDRVPTHRGAIHVYRSGSWRNKACCVRAAWRHALPRDLRLDDLGFRLAGGQESGGTANESIHVRSAQGIASQFAAELVVACPMTERKFIDGEDVLVWRSKRGEWVHGVVYGYAERDGVWKYFIQLSGYAAASADDPNSWFLESELQHADRP